MNLEIERLRNEINDLRMRIAQIEPANMRRPREATLRDKPVALRIQMLTGQHATYGSGNVDLFMEAFEYANGELRRVGNPVRAIRIDIEKAALRAIQASGGVGRGVSITGGGTTVSGVSRAALWNEYSGADF